MTLVIRYTQAAGRPEAWTVTLPAAPWQQGEPFTPSKPKARDFDKAIAGRILAALGRASSPLTTRQLAAAVRASLERTRAALVALHARGAMQFVPRKVPGGTAYYWKLPGA